MSQVLFRNSTGAVLHQSNKQMTDITSFDVSNGSPLAYFPDKDPAKAVLQIDGKDVVPVVGAKRPRPLGRKKVSDGTKVAVILGKIHSKQVTVGNESYFSIFSERFTITLEFLARLVWPPHPGCNVFISTI